ncbi:MAG: efflux RND transporter periplasmic adaptor subunit [bacterium]|nr:efflux RND transporter periplasmic adaptor subunit [bacterium]
MKKILLLLMGVALVAVMFALNRYGRQESGKSMLNVAGVDALTVSVTSPERQTIVRRVQAPGDVEAVTEVEIQSEIPAKIEEMPVEEGDRVEAGQLLCRLNDDQFRAVVESSTARVAALQATIRQAEADLTKTKRDCARQERLAQLDATSDTELADFRTELIKRQATVEIRRQELAEVEAMMRRAKEDLEKTVITAPIDGVVSIIYAEAGEIVITGTMNNPGTVIMVITDLSQMQVRARVDETDVPLVKPAQPVDIFLPSEPERAIPGEVLRVATSGTKALGRDVVTFETLVLVKSDDSTIKPGMTANVEILVARAEDALTLPVQAVVHRKRKDLPDELVALYDQKQEELHGADRAAKAMFLKVVFCMNDDQAHPRLVRTGIADESHVEVAEGLAAEDVVIIGPYRSLDQLKDGSDVKREEKEEAKDAETEAKEPETKLAADETDETEKADPDPDGTEVAEAQ